MPTVGEPDGKGLYGVPDETADGLLCHECGKRFTHLGLHVWRRHGMAADEFRRAHGLARSRGLVAAATRTEIAQNARDRLERKPAFLAARAPEIATAARLRAGEKVSPQGLESIREANRARRGRSRLGTVVICGWLGAEFCPLTRARRRRFCTRSCASKATRASRAPR
ncbi:MucR family transcriptional regulator [Georgenia deserti]|uniref:MucR family transcriptional regulator n=1 Tax=Georgenia deserti TaxID=2093781 RepID=A0ABW4KZB8_9MICO